MEKEKLLELISQTESLLKSLQSALAEEESVNENPTQETPVESIEEEVEELPAPPKEIYIDMPEDNEDVILGCKILTELPSFYDGECRLMKLHKRYFDNGQPKLFIDKYHVVIEAYDVNMQLLGSYTTHWNNLSKFHADLLSRGINTHKKDNWMPKVVVLDLD